MRNIVLNPAGGVSVQLLKMEQSLIAIERYRRNLVDSELERANRFKNFDLKSRFTFSRGKTRELLGERLGIDPQKVVIEMNEHGKPSLRNSTRLWFNVSHSHLFYAFATSENGPIGIDIEFLCGDVQYMEIAKSFLKLDYFRLCSMDPEKREREFFRTWTRREATFKALGSRGSLLSSISESECSTGSFLCNVVLDQLIFKRVQVAVVEARPA